MLVTEYSPCYSQIIAVNAHHSGQYPAAHYPPSDPAISFHSSSYDSVGYFLSDGPLQGQHQHSLIPVPSGYSHYDDYCLGYYEHYVQPPIPPILPSSSSSELGHALVETPPPESRPINYGSIALPSLPMPISPITWLSTVPLSSELVSHPKEESQEPTHVFPTPAGTHGRSHRQPHANDLFRLQDPAMYLGHTSPPPSKLAYSPSTRNPAPLSSSFLSSDIGMPTSSIHLDTNAASSSQVPPPASAPLPKAGQGCVEVAVKTNCTAQTYDRLLVLPAPVGSADLTCNQCARRSRKCEYPTMLRRGLHKRRDNRGSHHKESEDADYVPNP
ncbi:hypothetical protein EDB84DRAFT_1441900 [Lactarius hengduanensis]|nr:hypothetical protein EDB84DRAFT_1441900 [Lactarius hengduanensis]